MKIDIVLLSWNFRAMTLDCLRAIKEETHIPYRIIWIDNGSKIKNFELVKKYVETFEDYIIFRFDKNQYYAKGTNKGIKLSNSKYVVTLSNDVFVTKDWLTKLVSIMENQPEIGLLSPLTNKIGSNCPRASYTVSRLKLLKSGEPHEKINELPSRFIYCNGNVSMFCAILRKEMVEKIGLLDEQLPCYGNDNDYNDRVRHSGYKSAVALNCFVYHLHNTTKNQIFSVAKRKAMKSAHSLIIQKKRRQRTKKNEKYPRKTVRKIIPQIHGKGSRYSLARTRRPYERGFCFLRNM